MSGVGELTDHKSFPYFRFSYVDGDLTTVEFITLNNRKKSRSMPHKWNISTHAGFNLITTPELNFPDCNYRDSILLDEKVTVAKISCISKNSSSDFYIYLFEPLGMDSIKVVRYTNAGSASLTKLKNSFESCGLDLHKGKNDLILLKSDSIFIKSLINGKYEIQHRYLIGKKKRIRILYEHYFFY